jgi:hypothetical protein
MANDNHPNTRRLIRTIAVLALIGFTAEATHAAGPIHRFGILEILVVFGPMTLLACALAIGEGIVISAMTLFATLLVGATGCAGRNDMQNQYGEGTLWSFLVYIAIQFTLAFGMFVIACIARYRARKRA